MIGIPGSVNSKYVLADGDNNNDAQIEILQMWNGYRPKINLLAGSFYVYLVDQEITGSQKQKYHFNMAPSCITTRWIEKLLQTQIADYRKSAVSLILAPYLINIKRISYKDAFNIINNWLSQ
jgi:hypothetical protein